MEHERREGMSKRYQVVGGWRERERQTVEPTFARDADKPEVVVVLESADIHSRDGWDYQDGAYRVKATAGGRSYRRARTFYGETAWMDGERLFGDIVNEVRYGR
jgi:hypothetical protein